MCCIQCSEALHMGSHPAPHIQAALHVIHSFIHYTASIRRSGALRQTTYGSPPACPFLGCPPPVHVMGDNFLSSFALQL